MVWGGLGVWPCRVRMCVACCGSEEEEEVICFASTLVRVNT